MNTQQKEALIEKNKMIDEIYEKINANMHYSKELVFVDRGDELTEEQVEFLVRNDLEGFYESLWDWESEVRYDAAHYLAQEAMDATELTDEEQEVFDEHCWDIKEMLTESLLDYDESDVAEELARHTLDVTMMIPLIDEDDTEWGEERKASQLCEALGTRDEGHYRTAKELISEAPTDVGMAYIVVDVSVVDIYNGHLQKGTVTVDNPCVVYGNPMTGGVWAANFKGLKFTAKSSSMMLDGDWGYGCEEVWGCNPTNNYERAVFSTEPLETTTPLPAGSLAWLDTLRDYCDRWG